MEQLNITTKKSSYKHFTEVQRYKLEAYLAAKMSIEDISKELKKNRSTIYREINRGRVLRINSELKEQTVYRANTAQSDYERKVINRERSLKIGNDKKLEDEIRIGILKKHYSPDAIIGRLRQQNKKFKGMICTKTLYSYIDRGILSGITNEDLWQKRKRLKNTYKKILRISHHNLNGKSIEERDESIDKRQECGHWEGDLVKGARGKNKACLLTLTERKSRGQITVKLKQGTNDCVVNAIDGIEKKNKQSFRQIFKTITFDNGSEFLNWKRIENSALNAREKRTTVYFAHPYSSWERGSNEVQNRMIRRFIPKGTDISKISEKKLKEITEWMNNYPRKILGYKTANEVLVELTNDNRNFN